VGAGEPVRTGDERRAAPSEGVWAARPGLALLLRVAIFLTPLACALGVTAVARRVLGPPETTGALVAQWVVLLSIGVGTALGAERLARRLLPLATLLKLSMLFPSRAPSRFKVARAAGSVRQLESAAAADREVPAAAPPHDEDSAATILALVARLSAHDRRTRGHAERVRVYTDMIAEEMKLVEADRYRLRWAALLHDIGKLSIDPRILNKTGELTEEEWDAIKAHPVEGMRIAAPLVAWLGPWARTISHHHEHFDGAGYPKGISGTHIARGARIVAVADSYDTMTSVRSYKKPMATRAAREELVRCAGTQFDPVVVRAFLAVSLPRLLWATGPVSLLVHLPFLARLKVVGEISVASAATAVTATAAAGVVAVGLMAPGAEPALRATSAPAGSEVAVDEGGTLERDGRDRGGGDGKDDERDGGGRDRGVDRGDTDGTGGGDGDDGGRTSPTPVPEPSPTPTPSPSPEPSPAPSPAPGRHEVTVPDVVGMTQNEATAVLEAAGFVVQTQREWVSDKADKNLVIAQSEPAGSTVPEGSTIVITVGKWRNKD
jgi:HD-GYP domain-containing protein (c-di-GMP phosphodiesterase class II)